MNLTLYSSHDFLFIENGKGEFRKLTGKIQPQIIKSINESELTIRFTTDHKGSKKGFRMSVRYVLDGKQDIGIRNKFQMSPNSFSFHDFHPFYFRKYVSKR